jgi:AcrR family transcriptional regulator
MAIQDRAKATRGAIIAGAAEVFEEHGYNAASLTQVAEAAQVTKGALYFHFQSKEDLAIAVIDEQHRAVVRDAERILAEERPALICMILMCRAFGLHLINEPVVRAGIRLTFEATTFGAPIRQPYEDWISTMEHLVAKAQHAGHIRAALDSAALARYIVASYTGVQMVSEVLTARTDVMERIQDMWAILLPGIVTKEVQEEVAALAGLVSGKTSEPEVSLNSMSACIGVSPPA